MVDAECRSDNGPDRESDEDCFAGHTGKPGRDAVRVARLSEAKDGHGRHGGPCRDGNAGSRGRPSEPEHQHQHGQHRYRCQEGPHVVSVPDEAIENVPRATETVGVAHGLRSRAFVSSAPSANWEMFIRVVSAISVNASAVKNA